MEVWDRRQRRNERQVLLGLCIALAPWDEGRFAGVEQNTLTLTSHRATREEHGFVWTVSERTSLLQS